MLHPLVLVKIKNCGTEHHLESFFEIAFIDGSFSAQGPYGDGITDVLKQDFPCLDDFFSRPDGQETYRLEPHLP